MRDVSSALHIPHFGHVHVSASNVIASLALIVSVIALARPWWIGRKAALTVRYQVLPKVQITSASGYSRFNVHNFGPAKARKIELTFTLNGAEIDGLSLSNYRGEIPELHALDEFHIDYQRALNDVPPDAVRVTWRDGRLRRQSRTFWLSKQYP